MADPTLGISTRAQTPREIEAARAGDIIIIRGLLSCARARDAHSRALRRPDLFSGGAAPASSSAAAAAAAASFEFELARRCAARPGGDRCARAEAELARGRRRRGTGVGEGHVHAGLGSSIGRARSRPHPAAPRAREREGERKRERESVGARGGPRLIRRVLSDVRTRGDDAPRRRGCGGGGALGRERVVLRQGYRCRRFEVNGFQVQRHRQQTARKVGQAAHKVEQHQHAEGRSGHGQACWRDGHEHWRRRWPASRADADGRRSQHSGDGNDHVYGRGRRHHETQGVALQRH